MPEDNRTQEKILKAAKEEFMEKGFPDASLRNIVKTAGVTTGAFYRYYPTKEALFEALVKPHADHVVGILSKAITQFGELPAEEQTPKLNRLSNDALDDIIDYIYGHYDSFKILICSSYGTLYENFIHELAELEVMSTYKYMDVLRSLGHSIPPVDQGLCHMIASGLLSGIFEIVVHDMKREDGEKWVRQLRSFYTGGWEKLFGIKFC